MKVAVFDIKGKATGKQVELSDEIFGTQFHPEADPTGFIKNLEDEKNKEAMIETFGMEKYLETIDRMDDDDKIVLIFEYLRQLEQSRQQQDDQANRQRIGFRK